MCGKVFCNATTESITITVSFFTWELVNAVMIGNILCVSITLIRDDSRSSQGLISVTYACWNKQKLSDFSVVKLHDDALSTGLLSEPLQKNKVRRPVQLKSPDLTVLQ